MSERLPNTENVNPKTAGLDRLDTPQLVATLVEEQRGAVGAVAAVAASIAIAVDEIAARLQRGGSLHYVGAGTSGRLATLDASELPPTFGAPPELVRAHVAGGRAALVRAIEDAEDDAAGGVAAVDAAVRPGDAVVGISASGGAAFVVAAVRRARFMGAYTVGLVNSDATLLGHACDIAIVLATGAEAIAGSTRLRAGTAQKIALNAISTAVMVRLGKVYDNLMVDVVATNRKLRDRAQRLVRQLTGVDEARAAALLAAAEGHVKVAVVMQRRGVEAGEAAELLARVHGSLREAL